MAKSSTIRPSTAGQFSTKPSAASELATFRAVVARLKKDPVQLRKVAIDAGISTPTGKLTKAYGGK
jgi:hypothetical protein